MKEYLLLLTLTLSWLLGGCRSLGTLPETPTPDPTSTFQATKPPIPTMTTTVTPGSAPTVVPTEITIEPSAIPAVIETIIAISDPRVYSSHLSPDGKWQAEVLIYDCFPVSETDENAYEQLKLTQTGSDIAQIVDTQLQSCGGLGAFGLAGLFWSPNSRYFYYTNAREGVPDGCGYWEPPFLRLDVTGSGMEYLGGGTRSVDGTKLATWQEQELVIWHVNAGEMARIPAFATGVENGPISWSPDSQSLVYVQVESYCPVSGMSYAVRVDLPELRQTLLLASETPSFGDATWASPNELILNDEDGDEWRYDFNTRELQQSP